ERADRNLTLGKGVLHRGEAEQHHGQHEPTGDRRLGDVVGDLPRDDEPTVEDPGDVDDPGGDQKDRAVVAAQSEQQDQEEAGESKERQNEARYGGGDRGLEEGEGEERKKHDEQRQRQVDETQMPAVQVEVDEEKAEQRRCY